MNLLWTIPLGLLMGVTLGALGGGGAILTVPALVYLLGQEPKVATTGSLIIVGITALTGLVPHHRKGNVRLKQGLLFGVLGVLGSLVGSRLSVRADPHLLMTLFAALMLVVAVLMIRKLRRRNGSDEGTQERGGWLVLVLTATGVGLLTGFFGVGGGFAVVPALTLVLGVFTLAAIAGSFLGGKIAGHANPRHLSIAFVVMLLGLSAFMLIQNVPRLIG